MAVAGQLNPDRYNRILDDRGNDRSPVSRKHRRLRWLWLWPLAAALVFWWARWGWGTTGGWWFNHNRAANSQIESQPSPYTAQPNPVQARQPSPTSRADAAKDKLYTPASGADIVASREKVIYIGKRFQASDIPIQRRVSPRVLWIGQGTPMLAVVNGAASTAAKNAGPGRDVNAMGVVRQAPPPDQAKQKWALSDEDTVQLEQQGAYIELSQLTVPETAANR